MPAAARAGAAGAGGRGGLAGARAAGRRGRGAARATASAAAFRTVTVAPSPAPAPRRGRARAPLLSPVQRRELKLLGRDRNFLVQTTVTPLLVVGFQLALTMGVPGGFSLAAIDLTHLAALGFGIAAYTMMFSAFQTLNNEGGALWLLYTLPRSLGRILLDKALLWGGLALAYPLLLFVAAAVARPEVPPRAFLLLAIALLGVPIYALIATSLGVFGANPLAQEVQRKIRPSHAYLYLLLSSLYTFAIYATGLWQRSGLLILTLLLALALWQKARDRLPYLLDPSAAPPPRVSLADGMLAALLFFVVQALMAILLARKTGKLTGTNLVLAFVVAGAVASIGTRLVHRFMRATGIPRVLGPGSGRAALWGLVGGALAARRGGGLPAGGPALSRAPSRPRREPAQPAQAGRLAGGPGGAGGARVRGGHLPGAGLRGPAPLGAVFPRRRWPAPPSSRWCIPPSRWCRCSRWPWWRPTCTNAPTCCSRRWSPTPCTMPWWWVSRCDELDESGPVG